MAKNELLNITKLDQQVAEVMNSREMDGFAQAMVVAKATHQLKEMLNDVAMKEIMELQGSRLGFVTDKDKAGGYPLKVVRDCLIEAVLTGVQPTGNQFNIISGNCYITKEGFGYMLKNVPGLSYKIIPDLPRIDKNSAAVKMNISWTYSGEVKEEVLDIPVKTSQYSGTDAVLGKATRKARAWLYNTVCNTEVGDGDVADLDSPAIILEREQPTPEEVEEKRVKEHLNMVETLDDLELLENSLQTSNPAIKKLFRDKARELSSK